MATHGLFRRHPGALGPARGDRKSTRLNSSHVAISYAVSCLKDNIVSPEPLTDWVKLKSKAKELAKGLRYREIYSNSLMPKQDAEKLGELYQMIHTLNPISKDMTTLRPSLLYGFLSSVCDNFRRLHSFPTRRSSD